MDWQTRHPIADRYGAEFCFCVRAHLFEYTSVCRDSVRVHHYSICVRSKQRRDKDESIQRRNRLLFARVREKDSTGEIMPASIDLQRSLSKVYA